MSTVADCFRRVFWIVLLVALHVAFMPPRSRASCRSPRCCLTTARCATAISSAASTSTTTRSARLRAPDGAAGDRPARCCGRLSVRRDAGLVRSLRGRCRNGLPASGRRVRRCRSSARPAALNLTALLWPLLPLSQAPQMSAVTDGATHYRPAQHLRIGLHYEQQVRVGPFKARTRWAC